MLSKIMVVEDEPAIADNITYALRTEGFEPTVCQTGAEALKQMAAGGFSLAILDVGLPDMNGFDLCRELRKTNAIPVIFLTARGGEVDRVVGLELGGDDYMIKPFSPRELTARVRAILRRIGGTQPPHVENCEIRHGRFAMDNQRRRITYQGRELPLSRYEYQLLEVFLRRPGWVYTRAKLMELAWDEPDASFERTVDTHMKTLRSKLRGIDPASDPFETHRGIGYSLKDAAANSKGPA